MSVEIFDEVGGEKLERLIARHHSVDRVLNRKAEIIARRAEHNLELRAYTREVDPGKAKYLRRGRKPGRIVVKKAKIDYHIILDHPAAHIIELGSRWMSPLNVLRDAL